MKQVPPTPTVTVNVVLDFQCLDFRDVTLLVHRLRHVHVHKSTHSNDRVSLPHFNHHTPFPTQLCAHPVYRVRAGPPGGAADGPGRQPAHEAGTRAHLPGVGPGVAQQGGRRAARAVVRPRVCAVHAVPALAARPPTRAPARACREWRV
eukprot:351596-Chlamydomonas_euryale.AAC.8